uniref:hypothetical protein n=1 Tax=Azospirillum argentinense TaxID=2970906 RepID=UPI0010C13354|nr:hypothetical protein [Azospirillum argentinense]
MAIFLDRLAGTRRATSKRRTAASDGSLSTPSTKENVSEQKKNNKGVVRFMFHSEPLGSMARSKPASNPIATIHAALHAVAGGPAPPEPYGLVVSG